MMTNNFEYKICLLGDSGVGKSSIVQRFVHNTFNACNENTIGASFMTKTMLVKNTYYKLNIWDTAGQERYKALAPMYYRGAKICLVVYDITSRESFDSVQRWIRELRAYLFEKCIIGIVGNKCDLSHKRAVTQLEAKEYANSVGAYFVETSAENSHNINELFVTGLNRYKELEQSDPNKPTKSTSNDKIRFNNRNDGTDGQIDGKSKRCC